MSLISKIHDECSAIGQYTLDVTTKCNKFVCKTDASAEVFGVNRIEHLKGRTRRIAEAIGVMLIFGAGAAYLFHMVPGAPTAACICLCSTGGVLTALSLVPLKEAVLQSIALDKDYELTKDIDI